MTMERVKRYWSLIKQFWPLIGIIVVAVLSFTLPLANVTWIGDYVLIRASFYSAVLFIVVYTLLAPWWRNAPGRMFVALDFGVMCALLGDVIYIELGREIPAWLSTRVVVFGLCLVAGTIISRTVLLGSLHHWKFRLPWRHDGQ
jgi:hypothetical protein